MTDDEVTRLRALLGHPPRAGRTGPRRLAAAADEPPTMTAGQEPRPLPDLPGRRTAPR
ncbi:hypothetical protein [Geodermatophilus sp. URMC 65]